MWFLSAFLYFIEMMLGRLQNIVGRQSCTRTERWVLGSFFSILFAFVCSLRWKQGDAVPDTEKMGRCSELQSASQRRPLWHVLMILQMCVGDRGFQTFIVITEAALCWSHFRCIFFSFFTQKLQVFGCMCSPNVYRHTNPHASMLT